MIKLFITYIIGMVIGAGVLFLVLPRDCPATSPTTVKALPAKATPSAVPTPKPRLKVTRTKTKAPVVKRKTKLRTKISKPRSNNCVRVRDAVNKYGMAMVKMGAAQRGYSEQQITSFARKCGIN